MNSCPSCQNQLELVTELGVSRMVCQECNFAVVLANPIPPQKQIKQQESEQIKENPKPPSIIKKAANFSKAIVKHVRDGFVKTPERVFKHRMDICSRCDKLNRDESMETLGDCLECGCPVSAKARWASEACPIGKWGIYMETRGGCGSCGKNT